MQRDVKILAITALLFLLAIAVILGMMAVEGKTAPPIVDVDVFVPDVIVPEVPVNIEVTCDPIIEIDPCIEAIFDTDVPRYDEETVKAIMRDYDYPWPLITPLKVEHHEGRIWYVYATFQGTKRLYVFDEPL